MTGIVGNNTDATGTNFTVSGTSINALNVTDTQTMVSGDVVTLIGLYVQTSPGTDASIEIGLYASSDAFATPNAATLVWSGTLNVPAAFSAPGWHTQAVSNEAITATAGHTLGAALGGKLSGDNFTVKSTAATQSRSDGSDEALPATWTESASTSRDISLYITTAAVGGGGGQAPRSMNQFKQRRAA